jgi:hypothetical protein
VQALVVRCAETGAVAAELQEWHANNFGDATVDTGRLRRADGPNGGNKGRRNRTKAPIRLPRIMWTL